MKKRWRHLPPWKSLIKGEFLIFLIWEICYRDWIWFLFLQAVLFPFLKFENMRRKEKEDQEIRQAFLSMLRSLMTSMQAGYALENAGLAAIREMEKVYSKRHPIWKPLKKIERGILLQIPMWKLFYQLAQDTEVEEIYQFAVVVEIAIQTGGNLVEIIRNTVEQLQIKLDADQEIKVLISGKIFEKNIMLVMPFAILLYLQWMNASYIRIFYENLVGHLVMSVLLAITGGCFYWTEKIINRCVQ